MRPELSLSEAFQPQDLLDGVLPIVERGPALVSRSGLCVTGSGQDKGSFHSGYPELARELMWTSVGQIAKRGLQVSSGSEPHLLFHAPWSSGYYHWLIDAIPRLLSLRDHWGEYSLIVPDPVPNFWFKEWLIEISGGKYAQLTSGGLLVRRVVFQHCTPRSEQFSTHGIHSVAEYFLSRFAADQAPEASRLYISRSEALTRKIANEVEVLDCLADRGFVPLILEKMSFPDQVRAFAAAEAVVSIHGAGLTNSIFMHSGARLLELIQRPDPAIRWARRRTHLLPPYFRALADIKGLKYDALFCDPDFGSPAFSGSKRCAALTSNLRVEIASLRQKIDRLLDGGSAPGRVCSKL